MEQCLTTTKPSKLPLRQLGWQAIATDIVAHPACYGIDVSEGLVSRVKVESLTQTDEVKHHEEKVKKADKRRDRPMPQNTPRMMLFDFNGFSIE